MPQIGCDRSDGGRTSLIGRLSALAWVIVSLVTACTSPHDYKFPVTVPDQAFKDHKKQVKDCSFGGKRSDLYEGYDVRNHIVEATEQGGINYPEQGKAKDDFGLNFGRVFNCYRKYREWAAANQKEFRQVLIYFNGGLNPAEVVLAQAESQVPKMLEDGYYPIFLIWPTGPLDTYLEQITFVRNGVRRSNAQLLRAPLYFAGDLGQGLARAPVTYLDRFLRAVAARNPSDKEDKREFFLEPKICRKHKPKTDPQGSANSRSEPCEEEETDVSRFGINGCAVTAERNLVTGVQPDRTPGLTLRDLPYYGLFATRFVSAPLVDAFGTTMWENMVRRTRTTIRRPIEFDINLADDFEPGQIQHVEQDKLDFPGGIGAFAKFFTMLQYCTARKKNLDGSLAPVQNACPIKLVGAAQSDWWDIQLTVIGHSMGTMVMNELIPLHPDLPYRNLVFMAAAASVRDSTRAMSPVVIKANNGREKDAPLRFYNLMLHPQNDANELVALGAAPSGSLLAWVDEMYENPKTAIDRTMGKWRNLRATRHVFPEAARRNMLFRVFNWASDWEREQYPVGNCDQSSGASATAPTPVRFRPPTTHSGFNDDEAKFWCPIFWGADKVRWWGPGTQWPAQVCTVSSGE